MKKKFFLSCLLIVMALLPAVAQIQDPVQFKTELKTISEYGGGMLACNLHQRAYTTAV